MKEFRARFFLLKGEYWCQCPRCDGRKTLKERVDHTSPLLYITSLLFNVKIRRTTLIERVKCWLCKGQGRRLERSGYLFYCG
jgi:hypothetical protein